jgi:hypothetical protein
MADCVGLLHTRTLSDWHSGTPGPVAICTARRACP